MKPIRVCKAMLLILAALLLPVTPASADGPGYNLSRCVVAGGGGESFGGDYVLKGTAGQAEAGLLSGSDYVLGSGFWYGIDLGDFDIYLPLVLKNK